MQGSRGPGRSPREQPSHFARRVGGTPRSRLPVPLMPVVQRGESRVVCATWLIPGACHSPADTSLVSCPVTTRCRLRSQSPAHPCSPVGDTHLRRAPGAHQARAVALRPCGPPLKPGPGAVPRGVVPPERPARVKAGAPLCSARVLKGQALIVLMPCPSTPPLFQS